MMAKCNHGNTRSEWNRAGFSLLELVIITLILGIAAAVAVPKYASSLNRYRTQVASQRLAQDIELCRRYARFTSQNVTLTVSFRENAYRASPLNSPLRRGTTYNVVLGDTSNNVAICPVINGIVSSSNRSTTPDITIVFDRYGVPNRNADIGIQCGTSSGIVRLSAQGIVTRS